MKIGIANHKLVGKVKYLANDHYIAKEALSKDKLFEEDLVMDTLAPIIKKSKYILDIGAHIGCHTLLYNYINPEANIKSFELQGQVYSLLKSNVEGKKGIETFNCAVGDSIKMVTIADKISDGPNSGQKFSYSDDKEYNYGGVSIGEGSDDKMMITIDSLGLEGCDFIKIDVEGFEYFVILGAIKTIMKYRPVIFYECGVKRPNEYMIKNSTCNRLTPIMQVHNLLLSIGYRNMKRHDLNVLVMWD